MMSNEVRLSISFPPKIYSSIQELAIDNNRSFTKQVIFMLKELLEMGKYGDYIQVKDVGVVRSKSLATKEKVYIGTIGGRLLKMFHNTYSGAESYGNKVRRRYINKLRLEEKQNPLEEQNG